VHTIKEGKKVVHDHGTSYKPDWHEYENEDELWSHDAADTLQQLNRKVRTSPPTGNNIYNANKGKTPQAPLKKRDVDTSASTDPQRMSSEDETAFRSSSDAKRIDLIHKQIGLLWSDITRMRQQIDQQQNEVTQLLSRVEGHVHTISGDTDNTKHTVEMLEREVDVIKNSVRGTVTLADMKREIEGLKEMLTHNKDFKEILEVMNWKMSDHHEDFHEGTSFFCPSIGVIW
jgi:predicted RNase H-like nuclease (RuvC/YqgF family)